VPFFEICLFLLFCTFVHFFSKKVQKRKNKQTSKKTTEQIRGQKRIGKCVGTAKISVFQSKQKKTFGEEKKTKYL
jgi:hypothetical protein